MPGGIGGVGGAGLGSNLGLGTYSVVDPPHPISKNKTIIIMATPPCYRYLSAILPLKTDLPIAAALPHCSVYLLGASAITVSCTATLSLRSPIATLTQAPFIVSECLFERAKRVLGGLGGTPKKVLVTYKGLNTASLSSFILEVPNMVLH